MTDRYLRRKLTFKAHGRTLVLVKRANEKLQHRIMMALLWALYLPTYPDLRIDTPIGARYWPDLIQLDPQGQPLFWGEAGEVGAEKLRSLCRRYRSTHLVFAKWETNLEPLAAQVASSLLQTPRSAPVELIRFDANILRCIDQNGSIQINFADLADRVQL